MQKLAILALVLTSCHSTSESPSDWSFGGELQAYPAGVIAAVHAQKPINEQDAWTFRAGYNATDRHDWGEHDDETGGGPGLGVGWRRSLAPAGENGWVIGGRIDLWQLDIDWEDDPDGANPGGREGSTDVLVVQPTIEAGYVWHLEGSRLTLGAAFGAEINADTDGEDVGEGAIFLVGATWLIGG